MKKICVSVPVCVHVCAPRMSVSVCVSVGKSAGVSCLALFSILFTGRRGRGMGAVHSS